MKLIILIFCFLTLMATSFGKDSSAKKKSTNPKYSNVLCSQKYIPMKVEQTLNSNLLTVKFTAQRKIDQFTIKNVRGIEGVKITKFQEQNLTDIEKGEVVTAAVELSDFSGLVYVVFDVEITLNGMLSAHSIPVPVGALNQLQKVERAKNIKTYKENNIPAGAQKDGTNSLNTPTKKYHEMQVD